MSNIIDFASALKHPVERIAEPVECFPETRRQRAGRKRNPFARLHNQAGIAMRVVGRLHRGEALRVDDSCDEREWLRKPASATRATQRKPSHEVPAPIAQETTLGSGRQPLFAG